MCGLRFQTGTLIKDSDVNPSGGRASPASGLKRRLPPWKCFEQNESRRDCKNHMASWMKGAGSGTQRPAAVRPNLCLVPRPA